MQALFRSLQVLLAQPQAVQMMAINAALVFLPLSTHNINDTYLLQTHFPLPLTIARQTCAAATEDCEEDSVIIANPASTKCAAASCTDSEFADANALCCRGTITLGFRRNNSYHSFTCGEYTNQHKQTQTNTNQH